MQFSVFSWPCSVAHESKPKTHQVVIEDDNTEWLFFNTAMHSILATKSTVVQKM